VIEAGPAVKHEQGGLFPHHGTVRHELRALNVEEQPHPVDEHVHGAASLPVVDPLAQAACLF
jgi:hypothetical protein